MSSENNNKWAEMSTDELVTELKSAQSEMITRKFDNGLQGLDNPLVLRSKRRDIARMKTALRSLELASMSEEQVAKRDNIRRRRRK